jgi:hypothetical protein
MAVARYLFLFLFLSALAALAPAALAPAALAKEPALSFYDRCIYYQDDAYSKETQQASCACLDAAAEQYRRDQVAKNLNENAQAPSYEDIPKEDLYTRIYAPCLYITARDTAYDECYHYKKYYPYMTSNKQFVGMCNCMADAAEQYFKNYGGARLEVIISERGIERIDNPQQAILDDYDYISQINEDKKRCFNRFTGK